MIYFEKPKFSPSSNFKVGTKSSLNGTKAVFIKNFTPILPKDFLGVKFSPGLKEVENDLLTIFDEIF